MSAKAMVNRLRVRLDRLRARTERAEDERESFRSELHAVRRELTSRDTPADDLVLAVRDVISGFMSRTVALKEEKDARKRAEAECASLLRRLQLIAEAAEVYDHAERCGYDGSPDTCTCMLALVDVDTSSVPSGTAFLERLRAAGEREAQAMLEVTRLEAEDCS